jgi:hypothetical protein
MPYTATYINRLAQLGTVQYDLIITDTDGVLPNQRVPVSFKIDEDTEEIRNSKADLWCSVLKDKAESAEVKRLLDEEWNKREATIEVNRNDIAAALLKIDRTTWETVIRPLSTDPTYVLWAEADTFATESFDSNSRVGLLWLAIDPNCPSWRMQRILDVQSWWMALWTHYAVCKATLLAGQEVHFNREIPGPCPWTIWDISAENP